MTGPDPERRKQLLEYSLPIGLGILTVAGGLAIGFGLMNFVFPLFLIIGGATGGYALRGRLQKP